MTHELAIFARVALILQEYRQRYIKHCSNLLIPYVEVGSSKV